MDPHMMEKLHKGLIALEYRGYDSFGVAVQQGDTVAIQKYIGAPSSHQLPPLPGIAGMAHTRWATHGGVRTVNAHPHRYGRVTIVHNGILENYQYLAGEVPEFCPQSQTDTEVMAAYIDARLQQGEDPFRALQAFHSVAEGSYAVVLLVEGDDQLYFLSCRSPLCLGKGPEGVFVASDTFAFQSYTTTVNYLDDGDMGATDGQRIVVKRIDTLEDNPRRDVLLSAIESPTTLQGYSYHMLKEILEDTKRVVPKVLQENLSVLQLLVEEIQESDRVLFIGCGTSYYMAKAGYWYMAQLAPEIAQKKIQVFPAYETDLYRDSIDDRTLVIALSQSGETADVMQPLLHAAAQGARIACITNTPRSRIARMSHLVVDLQMQKEIAVASTKAATAQLVLLVALAYVLAGTPEYLQQLTTISGEIDALLNPQFSQYVADVAREIAPAEHLYIIGSGVYRALAEEAALKIAEVAYIHPSGLHACELKHGPLALLQEGFTVLSLGDDVTTGDNTTIAAARGGVIVGITHTRHQYAKHWLRIPSANAMVQPFLVLITVQLLAYHLSTLRGNNPDRPRNLAKSVTV
ncbi:glutamine--fructose-6-phosphate transaminase (isomerizing) [Candidatus Peribacteria bacterium]|nr:glutamine--fructose-6-phosphate transaminase (isomerizing) [Candidatus Peribacteria bacterium]